MDDWPDLIPIPCAGCGPLHSPGSHEIVNAGREKGLRMSYGAAQMILETCSDRVEKHARRRARKGTPMDVEAYARILEAVVESQLDRLKTS